MALLIPYLVADPIPIIEPIANMIPNTGRIRLRAARPFAPELNDVKKLLSWALKSVVAVEIILVALVWIFTDPFIAVFNSENNRLLLEYAHTGLRLYFLGFLFAGVNIMLVAYFSATANARPAIIGSLLRGAVAIGACAIVLSMIWGMNGVWLSFLTSEIITFAVLLILGRNKESRKMNEYV